MENFDLEKFYKLKNDTEVRYKKIISIFCPALRSEIIFNSDGFHHLRYDGNRSERNKTVQINKFIYFNKGVDVIKISTTVQEYRRSICPVGKYDKNGFRKTKTVEWFGFFSIINFSQKIRVKVVVRRIGGDSGQFHFWSVMPFWTLTNNIKNIGSNDIVDN